MKCFKQTVGKRCNRNFLPYYTNSPWGADDKFFIYFSETEQGTNSALYRYFPAEIRSEKIVDLSFLEHENVSVKEGDMLASVLNPSENKLYIPSGNVIYKVDIDSGCIDEFFRIPEQHWFGGPLCLSHDHRLLSGGCYASETPHIGEPEKSNIFVLDIASCKQVISRELPFFSTHFQFMAGNQSILFAHEGETKRVPDRLNVFQINTGDIRCLYRHIHDADGQLVEFIGHEKVAGSGVAAVRYPVSEIDFGLVLVNPESGTLELVDRDDYWHCSANDAGSRFVMDTMWWGRASRRTENRSDIILYDLINHHKQLLNTIKTSNKLQIHHPHPQLNAAGDKVLFISRDDVADDSAGCQIVYISLEKSD